MPTPMIHLCVANRLLNHLAVGDPGAYYLGSIAPDGIHTREGRAPREVKEDKLRSHLGARGGRLRDGESVDGFVADAVAFMRRRDGSPDRDFFVGYGVHLLTDIPWFTQVYEPFTRRYRESGAPAEDERRAYYIDVDSVEVQLYAECPWRAEVWRVMGDSPGADAAGIIAAEDARRWLAHLNRWFAEPRGAPECRYITRREIEEFVASVSDWIASVCL